MEQPLCPRSLEDLQRELKLFSKELRLKYAPQKPQNRTPLCIDHVKPPQPSGPLAFCDEGIMNKLISIIVAEGSFKTLVCFTSTCRHWHYTIYQRRFISFRQEMLQLRLLHPQTVPRLERLLHASSFCYTRCFAAECDRTRSSITKETTIYLVHVEWENRECSFFRQTHIDGTLISGYQNEEVKRLLLDAASREEPLIPVVLMKAAIIGFLISIVIIGITLLLRPSMDFLLFWFSCRLT